MPRILESSTSTSVLFQIVSIVVINAPWFTFETRGQAASFFDFKKHYKRRRRHMIRYKYAAGFFLALLGFLMVSPSSHAQEPNKPMVFEGTVGGWRIIEEGQPPVMIHATVEDMKRFREANPHAEPGRVHAAGTASELSYHGGIGGIGVETNPKVFLVL